MIEVKILNECTLLQACEWIAFKWEPMNNVYEQYEGRIRPRNPIFDINLGDNPKPSIEWDKYRDGLAKGVAALKIALCQKQINAVGRFFPEKNTSLGSTPLQPERTVIDFEEFFSLDTTDNQIIVGNDPIFYDILISFTELVSIFPGQNRKHFNTYKSEYMLLMEEVINQEGITDKNQSKQELLKDIIEQKMKDKGLPESNKLADAMATLIRQPWSQKGRNKKG